jgi:hypothetical protein
MIYCVDSGGFVAALPRRGAASLVAAQGDEDLNQYLYNFAGIPALSKLVASLVGIMGHQEGRDSPTGVERHFTRSVCSRR